MLSPPVTVAPVPHMQAVSSCEGVSSFFPSRQRCLVVFVFGTVAPRGSALTKTRALYAGCPVGLSTLVGLQRNVNVVLQSYSAVHIDCCE